MQIISGQNYNLYIEYKCNITLPQEDKDYGHRSKTASIQTYYRVLGEGGIYELKLPDDFTIKPFNEYCFQKNHKTHHFKNLKQLLRFYKDKNKEIETYKLNNKIDFNDSESISKFIQNMERI